MDLYAILNKVIKEIKEEPQVSSKQGINNITENAITDTAKNIGSLLGYGGAYSLFRAANTPTVALAFPIESSIIAGSGIAAHNMLKSPLEKKAELVNDKYNDVVDYAKDKYDDAISWANDHPELATALGVGIPGALLAGAGALALRRRQRNTQDK